MQVTETLAEGLKHEFKISVPASDLDAKADAQLVDLKDKVRLNGFRPGKVPVSHLKKVYGRSVMAETIDQTIRDTNSQIFTERGFRLATEPKITMPTEEKAVEDILAGKIRSHLHGCDRSRAGDPARRFQELHGREAGRRCHRRRRRRGHQAHRRPEPPLCREGRGREGRERRSRHDLLQGHHRRRRRSTAAPARTSRS